MFSLSAVGSCSKQLLPTFTRSFVNRAAQRPIPEIRAEPITSPNEFLKRIGRSMETKMSVEHWDEFWKTSGLDLRKAGMAVRDRRYLLWCMEKYRQGKALDDFVHEPRAKKTIRGWGPSVQNGKRIRSRRLKHT